MHTTHFTGYRLEVLTEKYLEEAIAIANQLLPSYASKRTGPEASYRHFVGDSTYVSLARYTEYYVVIAKNSKKVVGVIGWLVRPGKKNEHIAWLHWFGVLSEYRGLGVASTIFKWIENRVRMLGFRSFNVYTSTRKHERTAQYFYEKHDMKIIRRYATKRFTYLLRGKKLNITKPCKRRAFYFCTTTIGSGAYF